MRPKYSIVVPFHDEQESVRELHARLAGVMTGRFEPVEFVYVDDQSSDATPQILNEIALDDPRVTRRAPKAQLRSDHSARRRF